MTAPIAPNVDSRLLGSKALAVFGVFGLATIVIGTALTLWYTRAVALQNAEREIANLTRVLSEQTSRAMQGVDLILRGTRSRLREGKSTGALMEPQAIQALLRARTDGVPQVAQLFVLDANGDLEHISTRFPAPRMAAGDREYFRVHRERAPDVLHIGTPTRNRLDGKWSFQMSRRLAGSDEAFGGVIAASVEPDYFRELYRSIELPPGATISLSWQDGTLLVSEPSHADAIGEAPADAATFRAANAGSDAVPPSSGPNDGSPLISRSEISGFPLVVSVALDEGAALLEWNRQALLLSGGAAIIVALFMIGLVVLARTVKRDAALTVAVQESRRQLRDLAAALQSSREQEQRRIARELHDELGQQLTGVIMELSGVPPQLRDDQTNLRGKVDRVQRLLHGTVGSVRRLCSELRPLMLDDLGLAAALDWLVESLVERTGIVCDLEVDGELELDDAHKSAVFRIVQEALTNVARHAKAKRVEVHISRRDGVIAIDVRDDGVGFDPAESRSGYSHGLVGMRERAYLLGGAFSMHSAPGKGARLQVRIPVVEAVGT